VVSAKGRVLGLADSSFENFIQTDAAINFGNSGGPLVNVGGQVVGINTAINAGGQNLGFAVPVNAAKRILPQLREKGSVVRGYLGAQIRNISPEIEEAFGLDNRRGAFVEEVVAGHAAAKAGLEHGDTVIAVNGEAVATTRDLIDTIAAEPPGTKVKLEVVRDGKRVTLEVELEERPGNGEAESTESPAGDASARAGVTVHELTVRLRQVYGIDDGVDGVVITRVEPVSPAGEEGLLPGDVIQEANGRRVATADALTDVIDAVPAGELLRLYVFRPRFDRSFFAILRLAD
jgi:serine protease Do